MVAQRPVAVPVDTLAHASDDEEIQRRRDRIEEVMTAVAAACTVLLISICSAVISLG